MSGTDFGHISRRKPFSVPDTFSTAQPLQSQSSLRFLQGYGCGLYGARLEQGHQPGICTSPGDLAVKIVDGHKKEFAAIRHPDNDVVDSSLIE